MARVDEAVIDFGRATRVHLSLHMCTCHCTCALVITRVHAALSEIFPVQYIGSLSYWSVV